MTGPIRTGLFQYVRTADIDQFHRDGWMVVDTLGDIHHGEYAALMWRCDCADVTSIDDLARRTDSRPIPTRRDEAGR